MSKKTYGYVRVSTKGQREDWQLAAMREFGVPAESIVIEKQSSKDFARPLYLQLVGMLEPGDVLVIKSIDRLGLNYEEILEQVVQPDQGEEGRHRRIGHAPAGHPGGPRPDRDTDRGYRAPAAQLRGADRAGFHPPAAGGGDRRGQRARRLLWPQAHPYVRPIEALAEDWWFGCVSAVQAGKELGISRSTFTRRATEWRDGRQVGLLRSKQLLDSN